MNTTWYCLKHGLGLRAEVNGEYMPYMELALPCMGVFETQKLRFLLIAVDALWAPNMETSNKRRKSKLLTVNRDPVLLVALPTGYLRLPCLYSTTTYSDSLLTLRLNTGHASLTIHDDISAHSKLLGHVRSHSGAQARHPLCRGSMCHLHASRPVGWAQTNAR